MLRAPRCLGAVKAGAHQLVCPGGKRTGRVDDVGGYKGVRGAKTAGGVLMLLESRSARALRGGRWLRSIHGASGPCARCGRMPPRQRRRRRRARRPKQGCCHGKTGGAPQARGWPGRGRIRSWCRWRRCAFLCEGAWPPSNLGACEQGGTVGRQVGRGSQLPTCRRWRAYRERGRRRALRLPHPSRRGSKGARSAGARLYLQRPTPCLRVGRMPRAHLRNRPKGRARRRWERRRQAARSIVRFRRGQKARG